MDFTVLVLTCAAIYAFIPSMLWCYRMSVKLNMMHGLKITMRQSSQRMNEKRNWMLWLIEWNVTSPLSALLPSTTSCKQVRGLLWWELGVDRYCLSLVSPFPALSLFLSLPFFLSYFCNYFLFVCSIYLSLFALFLSFLFFFFIFCLKC